MSSAADLPRDVLQHIQSLLPLVDYVRFPAVCTSWRSAAEHNPLPAQSEPMPWLIYFQSDNEDESSTTPVDAAIAIRFCPEQKTNKSYRIPIPEPLRHHRIVNPIDHRLILKDPQGEMCIVNPFSSSSWNQISPCSIPSLSSVRLLSPSRFYDKVVTDGTIAVAQVGVFGHDLVYTRLGSDFWIRLIDVMPHVSEFLDISASPSQPRLFYAASRPDVNLVIVFALDFSSSPPSGPPTFEFIDMTFNLGVDYIEKENPADDYQVSAHMRLVVLSSDIFLVRWRLMEREMEREDESEGEALLIRAVDVYKLSLDEIPENRRWVPVRTLGGRSFFLGRNQSISLSASESPRLKSDCIYFPWYPFCSFSGWKYDRGYNIDEVKYQLVYNLRDDSWERLYGVDDQSYNDFGWPNVWIIPRPSVCNHLRTCGVSCLRSESTMFGIS